MKAAALVLAFATLASPALAQDQRVWGYEGGEHPILYYAVPASDDVTVSFHCDAGEGVVRVLTFVDKAFALEAPRDDGVWVDAEGRPEPWPGAMTLKSGGVTVTTEAEIRSDAMSGGSVVEARIPPTAPVLSAFLRTGAFSAVAYGETESLQGAPKEKIAALLRDCAPR
jgi:hypothetical protein